MASLNRIGKDVAEHRHKDIPYRLLEPVPALSAGTDGGSLIVQGDNLYVLKTLLQRQFLRDDGVIFVSIGERA